MKKILILTLISVFAFSCQEDAETPDLQLADPFIEFDLNTRLDADDDGVVTVTEGGAYTATVENPFNSLNQDVTVTYSISGDAVFGTDFTIPDATAAGGSFVLINRNPDDNLDDNGNPTSARPDFDLDITFPTDGVTDGDKTLIITITGGTGANGAVFGVRSGLATASVLTVSITDAD